MTYVFTLLHSCVSELRVYGDKAPTAMSTAIVMLNSARSIYGVVYYSNYYNYTYNTYKLLNIYNDMCGLDS